MQCEVLIRVFVLFTTSDLQVIERELERIRRN
jgi:hypothetical protein